MILHRTELSEFVHNLVDGEQIVRNPRIHALIEAKLALVDSQHRKILATPVFSGAGASEVITWSTNVLHSEPVMLSSLSGGEYEHYKTILKDIMGEYKSAMLSAPAKTKELIEAALTCHSEDTIYCADDNIVIVEWGMRPKGNQRENILLGMDYTPSPDRPSEPMDGPEKNAHNPEAKGDSIENEDINNISSVDDIPTTSDLNQPEVPGYSPKEAFDDKPLYEDEETDKSVPEDIQVVDMPHNTDPKSENPEPKYGNNPSDDPYNGKPDDAVSDDNSGGERKDNPSVGGKEPYGNDNPPIDNTGGNKKKRGWKWLWWLLLLLLLLLLGFFFFNSCRSPMSGISQETSPIDTTKIGLSDDSLTYEVKNRVILLIVKGGGVSDFVKAFREQYPDKEKYVLENPDTIIPRIVLTLPQEEKKDFIDGLRSKFPQFELEVIPETMYKTSLMPNDPAMSDSHKRWYFDMCSVYDAWDMTMGDENVVVAVVDDGFDLSHPEISGKIVKPYNAVEHNANIFYTDEHGTHVAATAVGEANNQSGTAGIAPKCKLMPIQVGDRNGLMSTSAVLDGVLYAIAQGADVVNVSLGMQLGPFAQFLPIHIQRNIIANNFLDEQRVWERIFQMAEARNVTFVLAGGNDNVLIGIDPMKRSPKAIRVSAVQPDRYKANFSNYGDYSTLSAPGVDIYNATPKNGYAFLQGTSMASPIVAGGVALLKSKNRNYTTKQIADILETTGLSPMSDVGPIVNFANALNGKRTGGDETACDDVIAKYQELIKELEDLKRSHPDCLQDPDTLSIPVGAKLEDLYGLWMSTTRLYNEQEDQVVIYFEFNGTAKGNIYLVEPDNSRFSATTSIAIKNDNIYIDQDTPATNGTRNYNPYSFICIPDKMRHADGKGVNKTNTANKINFKLVKIK